MNTAIATTITIKGQVTIPVLIRRLLGLQPNDQLVFSVVDEKIIAEPVKNDFLSLYGSVKPSFTAITDFKKIRRAVRQEVAQQLLIEGI